MTERHCPAEHEWLPYLSGETSGDDLSSHLAGCPGCQRRVAALRAAVDELRAVAIPPAETAEGSGGHWPTMIGRYPIAGPLDAGGQGLVYRAVHPTLNKELVIKLSRRPLAGKPDARLLLIAEGKILASLDHPNLVRVYDLDFHEDRPFLVMEYVRGSELGRYAATYPLRPGEAAALVSRLARAMEVIHRRGIIHQDIKPANILVDQEGQPRLIDFGLARLRHAWDDHPGTASGGTPAFMAPEQARGESERVGPAADLFALGAVLYFLLTGKAPFQGQTREESLDKAARCDLDREALRGVPGRLRAICLWALAENPQQRPRSAATLADALEHWQRLPRRLFLAGTAAVAGSVLAGGVWVLWPRTPVVPAPPPIAPAVAPALTVQVFRAGSYLDLSKALPLSTSHDSIRVIGKTPAGVHPALYSLSPLGRAMRLEVDLSPADTFTRVIFPRDGGHAPFDTGRGGTEFLLLCAGPEKAVAEDLSLLIEKELHKLPFLPADVLIQLDRQQPQAQVGVPFGPRQADPVAETEYRLDRLRQWLRGRFPILLGVAFSHED